MKTRTLMIAVTVLMLATGSAFAQMGGGGMGPGTNMMPGPMPGPGPNPGPNPGPGMGHMGGGMGYGMNGAGGMVSGMMGNTHCLWIPGYPQPDRMHRMTHGQLFRLLSIGPTAVYKSPNSGNMGLSTKQNLWTRKARWHLILLPISSPALVMPEMGMSMMLNASYGKAMYKTSIFRKKS